MQNHKHESLVRVFELNGYARPVIEQAIGRLVISGKSQIFPGDLAEVLGAIAPQRAPVDERQGEPIRKAHAKQPSSLAVRRMTDEMRREFDSSAEMVRRRWQVAGLVSVPEMEELLLAAQEAYPHRFEVATPGLHVRATWKNPRRAFLTIYGSGDHPGAFLNAHLEHFHQRSAEHWEHGDMLVRTFCGGRALPMLRGITIQAPSVVLVPGRYPGERAVAKDTERVTVAFLADAPTREGWLAAWKTWTKIRAQHNPAPRDAPRLVEVVEALGGVPRRGKTEFWQDVATVFSTRFPETPLTAVAAMHRWRRYLRDGLVRRFARTA